MIDFSSAVSGIRVRFLASRGCIISGAGLSLSPAMMIVETAVLAKSLRTLRVFSGMGASSRTKVRCDVIKNWYSFCQVFSAVLSRSISSLKTLIVFWDSSRLVRNGS